MITDELLAKFKKELTGEEKSENTINQYLRDVKRFQEFMGEKRIDKFMVIRYKEILIKKYKARSVNAKLSAINSFLKRMKWYECTMKLLKIQKESFRAGSKVLTKEEYGRLLDAARRLGNTRLNLAMQTLCAMGLRVSELRFVTVEAVRQGYAEVRLKGKSRTVLIPEDLRILLQDYLNEREIREGCVFVTAKGKPLDRSNIWREMKGLSKEAEVTGSKIYPHNLRHLFACVFYEKEKNANHLADIMGHSSLDTTRIYTQVSMEEELAVLNRMELVDVSEWSELSDRYRRSVKIRENN